MIASDRFCFLQKFAASSVGLEFLCADMLANRPPPISILIMSG